MMDGLMKWPKHYKPIPEPYSVRWLDSGHFIGMKGDEEITGINWDRYSIRRTVLKIAANASKLEGQNQWHT